MKPLVGEAGELWQMRDKCCKYTSRKFTKLGNSVAKIQHIAVLLGRLSKEARLPALPSGR